MTTRTAETAEVRCICGHAKCWHVGPDGVGLGGGPACHCGCDCFGAATVGMRCAPAGISSADDVEGGER